MALVGLEQYKDAFEHWVIIHPMLAGLAVFALTFIESLAVIGMLIPGTVLMTTCGALIGAQLLPATPTLLWAMAGAVLGDALSYGIGYYYKDHLRDIWPFRTHPKWVNNCEAFFERHGGKSVFLGRIGPLRAFVPIVAGMLEMRPIAFFAANIPSSILWAPSYMLPGILLGLASLQLPPSVATKFLAILLGILALLWLCGWLIKRLLHWLLGKFDIALTRLWQSCQTKPCLKPLYSALQDPYHPERHGQLTSACVLLILSALLLWLTYDVYQHTGLTHLNRGVHFFFRTLHSDWGMKIAIVLTMLGDKMVLLPMMIPVACYLFIKRQAYSAWHWLATGFLSAGCIVVLKHLIQSLRPTDLASTAHGFSFPSGHTTLSIALWGFIAVMIARAIKPRYGWIGYCMATIIASIVIITRLYLGAHWFTDIIGGILLGACCVLLVSISYRRLPTKPIDPIGLLLTTLLSFVVIGTIYLSLMWQPYVHNYTPKWPVLSISQHDWWHNTTKSIPLFRPNRFGHAKQLLNIQWQGDINLLRNTLDARGWQQLDDSSLEATLHRLAAKPADRKLPLMPVIYLNHRAVLTMVKSLPDYHTLLVLRLWDANIEFTQTKQPLYLGAVDYFTPRRHPVWPYWHHQHDAIIALPLPTTLFAADLGPLRWKSLQLTHAQPSGTVIHDGIGIKLARQYRILLIRPTS